MLAWPLFGLSGCAAFSLSDYLTGRPAELRIHLIIEHKQGYCMGRADYYKHGDNNVICDRCGFKYKASQLKREWNGLYTCPFDWEPRHPQDLIKSKHDDQRPSLSRPGAEDIFIPAVPFANAGLDQNVLVLDLVQLDGSLSYDPDGLPITYLWSQLSGAAVTLSSDTVMQPSFIAPNLLATEQLRFSLRVSNGGKSSQLDVVAITVSPVPGAWEVANMTLEATYSLPTGVEEVYSIGFSRDGQYLFWMGRDTPSSGSSFMRRITFAVPWDVSSIIDASMEIYPLLGFHLGMWVHLDGVFFLAMNFTGPNALIERYDMATPFELSTASLVATVPSGMLGVNGQTGISMNDAGDRMHLSSVDVGNSFIQGYTLVNGDINTIVLTPGDKLPINTWPPSPFGQRIYQHYIRYDNGLRLWSVHPNNDGVFQADLSSAFNLTSAVDSGLGATLTANTGITWKPDGAKVYVTFVNDGTLEQYRVGL